MAGEITYRQIGDFEIEATITTDSKGAFIRSSSFHGDNEFDVQELPDGIYYVLINGIRTISLVKESGK